ncbi:hypothetical protein RHGRI_037219 [Rhododendron griersonianum]|uniref:EF-hand domain-containing protein n=1 Tax=Rhododendron griersonianum TaxID=479676 RepID=A0AAV6HQZ9_9ERIC|nr:hypothetical protein RHGRI_037219 [Rhododendron griersonianum]KAG5516429.1 hypothetical protein RHGRI_037219 [Rhododendron griersonianum]
MDGEMVTGSAVVAFMTILLVNSSATSAMLPCHQPLRLPPLRLHLPPLRPTSSASAADALLSPLTTHHHAGADPHADLHSNRDAPRVTEGGSGGTGGSGGGGGYVPNSKGVRVVVVVSGIKMEKKRENGTVIAANFYAGQTCFPTGALLQFTITISGSLMTLHRSEHPWLQDAKKAPNVPLGDTVKARLKRFSVMNKLKKRALTADFDGDGALNYGEFVVVSVHLSKLANDEHLHKAFAFFELNKSGYIDLEEL